MSDTQATLDALPGVDEVPVVSYAVPDDGTRHLAELRVDPIALLERTHAAARDHGNVDRTGHCPRKRAVEWISGETYSRALTMTQAHSLRRKRLYIIPYSASGMSPYPSKGRQPRHRQEHS